MYSFMSIFKLFGKFPTFKLGLAHYGSQRFKCCVNNTYMSTAEGPHRMHLQSLTNFD